MAKKSSGKDVVFRGILAAGAALAIFWLIMNQGSGNGDDGNLAEKQKADSLRAAENTAPHDTLTPEEIKEYEALLEETFPEDSTTQTEEKTENISDSTSTENIENSISDSLEQLTPEDTLTAENETLKMQTLRVTKREGVLSYQMNNQTYNEAHLALSAIDTTKNLILMLAGNLTYSEEKNIKDLLTEQGIKFMENE